MSVAKGKKRRDGVNVCCRCHHWKQGRRLLTSGFYCFTFYFNFFFFLCAASFSSSFASPSLFALVSSFRFRLRFNPKIMHLCWCDCPVSIWHKFPNNYCWSSSSTLYSVCFKAKIKTVQSENKKMPILIKFIAIIGIIEMNSICVV